MYRFTALMIFALALGFQAAQAAPPPDVPSVVVHFTDLDLSRSEGAAALYRRLKGAAGRVCAPLDDRRLVQQKNYEACVKDAISAAVVKVNQPTLNAADQDAKTNRRSVPIRIAQK